MLASTKVRRFGKRYEVYSWQSFVGLPIFKGEVRTQKV
jgi:hypothetical protein